MPWYQAHCRTGTETASFAANLDWTQSTPNEAAELANLGRLPILVSMYESATMLHGGDHQGLPRQNFRAVVKAFSIHKEFSDRKLAYEEVV